LLVCGDTSWAMRLDEAAGDLARVGRMKGTKVMLKGNHDYWWETQAKMSRVLDPSIRPLNGASIVVERVAVAATRGWVCPNDSHFEDHDSKIYARELGRLRAALASLEGRRHEFDTLIVALHYSPVNNLHEPSGFTELIDQYHADACVYGHLHGEDIKSALTGRLGATTYYLVSADAVNFAPAQVLPA
jgi:hypothetical protein